MTQQEIPTAEMIRAAHARIKPSIYKTPVVISETLNRMFESKLFFKCENFQKGGAFKFRGATNALFALDEETAKKGVATHSSGNHAQALALAGKMRGVRVFVVMPRNAPAVKIEAVKAYGGEITFCEPTLEAREATLLEVVKRTGAHVIHAYNDYRIIAGQATAALELFEEVPDIQALLAPVGGGGLLSGTLLSTSYFFPQTLVYGVEPEGADDAFRSIKENRIIPSVNPKTIADGLLTSLGDKTFPIIKERVKEILTVSDEAIVRAMRLIWERMKIVVEPSGCVPLAALVAGKLDVKNKRIGLILSGGNVDLEEMIATFLKGRR